MNYVLATIATIAGIIAMIITGTLTRAALILALIASDVGFWLIVMALFVIQIC